MDNKIIKNIDRIVRQYVENESIPGLALGVVYKNEISYAKGFGVKDIGTQEKVDERSLFHMASVSKTFVATGIMQLVEQGKIDLDTNLITYLPYFKMDDERYKAITIRQLLCHISGMPDVEDYQWDNPQYDDEVLEKYVRSIQDKKLLWNPEERFAYSNIAFEILGDVIAKVSGTSFEDYMKVNVLNVIGMKESNFYKPFLSKELLTGPHILDTKNGYGAKLSPIFPYNRAHGPSSTLCSNIVEMCNYAIVNMNKGKCEHARLLSSDSYSELWKEYATTEWGGYQDKVGLAWFLGEYKGKKMMSHSGMDTGFRSELAILPEEEVAVVMMTNCDYINLNIITTAILEIVLGYEVLDIKISLAHHLAKILFDHNIELALEEYSRIKDQSNDKYSVIEDEFNYIAYKLLKRNRVREAIMMLQMSVKVFPLSANLYDSLGEIYLSCGEKKLALENYKRSVELDANNIEAKNIIVSLEEETI